MKKLIFSLLLMPIFCLSCRYFDPNYKMKCAIVMPNQWRLDYDSGQKGYFLKDTTQSGNIGMMYVGEIYHLEYTFRDIHCGAIVGDSCEQKGLCIKFIKYLKNK